MKVRFQSSYADSKIFIIWEFHIIKFENHVEVLHGWIDCFGNLKDGWRALKKIEVNFKLIILVFGIQLCIGC